MTHPWPLVSRCWMSVHRSLGVAVSSGAQKCLSNSMTGSARAVPRWAARVDLPAPPRPRITIFLMLLGHPGGRWESGRGHGRAAWRAGRRCSVGRGENGGRAYRRRPVVAPRTRPPCSRARAQRIVDHQVGRHAWRNCCRSAGTGTSPARATRLRDRTGQQKRTSSPAACSALASNTMRSAATRRSPPRTALARLLHRQSPGKAVEHPPGPGVHVQRRVASEHGPLQMLQTL
jgi:hypothetical protein